MQLLLPRVSYLYSYLTRISKVSRTSLATVGILLLLLLSVSVRNGASANQGPAAPQTQWLGLASAQTKAQLEAKALVFMVSAPWCESCQKMQELTFGDAQVATYVNENLLPVPIDAESDQPLHLSGQITTGRQLAQNFRVKTYPSVVYVRGGDTVVIPGHQKPANLLDFLQRLESQAK
ncbi:MAG: thioredoxin fold domain-containing protein [Bernardetiaceae bacterium]|jgi:thioredoxin-related protein|nr:thioredoxin fold domain-containing protein [Bernardetiaceae bacterium]